MENVLCRFRFPSLDLCSAVDLYVRPRQNAEYSMLARQVRLAPGGAVDFNTYFNALGLGRLLRHTTLRRVSVAAQISGACRLDVVHERPDGRSTTVVSTEVATREPEWVDLSVPSISDLDDFHDGALYLRMTTSDEPATLHDACWYTADEPSRPAQLGIVIPTFNRPTYVRSNIDRLLNALADTPAMKDRVEVVVIDNARNLELELRDGDPVTVISNENTGGAGGFACGLLHFRQRPGITHVLFMDDDVSFDAEIVFRAVQLLSYARDSLLCIAGAMLREDVPTEQFEAGARFLGKAVYPTRAVGQGVDLADWQQLLRAEREDEAIDYGAWWFFAFPLSLTDENPLPAFLRGDDVSWGLRHAGSHTNTFGGIGLWHADFVYKNGPLSWFYDTRNFALIGALDVPGFRWWHLSWRYLNTCGRSLLSFKYTSAGHITSGVREFLEGPEHWLEVDQARLNETFAAYREERPASLTDDLKSVDDVPMPHGAAKAAAAVVSAITLGGNLLPAWTHRGPIGAVPMQDRALEVATFRSGILYRDERRQEGFVARRDRRRFFSLLFDLISTALRIPIRFGSLKRAYRAAYPRMVSDDYWNRQFGRRGAEHA